MSTFTASKTVRNWKVNECSNKWSMHDFIAPIDGSSNVRLAPHQRLLWKFWFIQIKNFEKKTNFKLSALSVKKKFSAKKTKKFSAKKKISKKKIIGQKTKKLSARKKFIVVLSPTLTNFFKIVFDFLFQLAGQFHRLACDFANFPVDGMWFSFWRVIQMKAIIGDFTPFLFDLFLGGEIEIEWAECRNFPEICKKNKKWPTLSFRSSLTRGKVKWSSK